MHSEEEAGVDIFISKNSLNGTKNKNSGIVNEMTRIDLKIR